MELKRRVRQMAAWIMMAVLCIVPVFQVDGIARAEVTAAEEDEHTLHNPWIEAADGKIVWDCIYFGNYYQSKYVAQPGNRPTEGEDDVVHTDEDGTKFLVRKDKVCYEYEGIKWRVLSVSEDGKDAFLMADKNLDAMPYHSEYSVTVTWEDSSIRAWLGGDFAETAFTADERDAIKETVNENKKHPDAKEDSGMVDGDATTDKIYLPSYDDMTSRAYGFVEEPTETLIRELDNTDFTTSGGTAKDPYDVTRSYFLRTMGTSKGNVSAVDGSIGCGHIYGSEGVDHVACIRPVLHLDLTKTDVWEYAGQVRQDKTVIRPGQPLAVPELLEKKESNVTMASGQKYPKDPVVDANDSDGNTWDCIYFGKYYNSKLVPSALSEAKEHGTVKEDGSGKQYLVRHREGYFWYEPIKWRVLSINEDGTDAFLMADHVLDVQPYYGESDVEITWEKSDIRYWLNNYFLSVAFSEAEQGKILDTEVQTNENPWSGEAGGNDTIDKIYLLSIEEAMDGSYGFSSDKEDSDTRKNTATDYAKALENLDYISSESGECWLRSPGSKVASPAMIGVWGQIASSSDSSMSKLGVRPVMHVDLTDTSLWTYAGQVTPRGVVTVTTEDLDPGKDDGTNKDPETGKDDGTNKNPLTPPRTDKEETTQKTDTTKTETKKKTIKKPGKPTIKKLENKKGKKLTVKLSKKVSGATGYQIAYATKSSMKGQKTKTFKGTSITIKSLKKKKTYYIRVRAYTKKNGQTVYGSWSKKKSIKIKK